MTLLADFHQGFARQLLRLSQFSLRKDVLCLSLYARTTSSIIRSIAHRDHINLSARNRFQFDGTTPFRAKRSFSRKLNARSFPYSTCAQFIPPPSFESVQCDQIDFVIAINVSWSVFRASFYSSQLPRFGLREILWSIVPVSFVGAGVIWALIVEGIARKTTATKLVRINSVFIASFQLL